MSKLPHQYQNITVYDVISRVTIKDILEHKDYYRYCHYVIDEADDPLPISDSILWLRSQRSNKKAWVMKYKNEKGGFVK